MWHQVEAPLWNPGQAADVVMQGECMDPGGQIRRRVGSYRTCVGCGSLDPAFVREMGEKRTRLSGRLRSSGHAHGSRVLVCTARQSPLLATSDDILSDSKIRLLILHKFQICSPALQGLDTGRARD